TEQISAAIPNGQNGTINRPAIGFENAAANIFSAWIGTLALEHPHAVVLVSPIVGGVIDEPATIDEVKFWCPNVIPVHAARWGLPNTNPGVLANAGDGTRSPDANLAPVPTLQIIIVTAMIDHPWVGRVGWQNRVYNFALSCGYCFVKPAPLVWCPLRQRAFRKRMFPPILRRPIFVSWFVRQNRG